jgi:hypothetical protein
VLAALSRQADQGVALALLLVLPTATPEAATIQYRGVVVGSLTYLNASAKRHVDHLVAAVFCCGTCDQQDQIVQHFTDQCPTWDLYHARHGFSELYAFVRISRDSTHVVGDKNAVLACCPNEDRAIVRTFQAFALYKTKSISGRRRSNARRM